MTVKQLISDDDKQVTLTIVGRFDFSLHQQFRESYLGCDLPETLFIIDLANTDYIDSSALGMILLLKDHADQHQGKLEIVNANEVVNKTLEIAQFHKLFTIS